MNLSIILSIVVLVFSLFSQCEGGRRRNTSPDKCTPRVEWKLLGDCLDLDGHNNCSQIITIGMTPPRIVAEHTSDAYMAQRKIFGHLIQNIQKNLDFKWGRAELKILEDILNDIPNFEVPQAVDWVNCNGSSMQQLFIHCGIYSLATKEIRCNKLLEENVPVLIRSLKDGTVLDATEDAYGRSVLSFPWHGGTNQKWQVQRNGKGYLIASNLYSQGEDSNVSMALDEDLHYYQVGLWPKHDFENQRWLVIPVVHAKNTYFLRNAETGRFLTWNHNSRVTTSLLINRSVCEQRTQYFRIEPVK